MYDSRTVLTSSVFMIIISRLPFTCDEGTETVTIYWSFTLKMNKEDEVWQFVFFSKSQIGSTIYFKPKSKFNFSLLNGLGHLRRNASAPLA